MLIYPQINPVALKLGPLAIHWYGLTYLIGIVGGWRLLQYRIRRFKLDWTADQLGDLVIYIAIGVVLGGRLGYVAFYNLLLYLTHPLQAFAIWDGGMAFYGGLLGVAIALLLYAKKFGRRLFELADLVIPVVPIGLGAGRIGNFINGELWGKVADVPWAMQLPCADIRFVRYCKGFTTGYSLPRHPSQLYEFLLEGVVLFTLLWLFSNQSQTKRLCNRIIYAAIWDFSLWG